MHCFVKIRILFFKNFKLNGNGLAHKLPSIVKRNKFEFRGVDTIFSALIVA